MISKCKQCKEVYWRYRRDFPPKGVCSLPCYDASREVREVAERLPADVLLEIYRHRRIVHNYASILEWFDCEECESLEKRYRHAIDYHLSVETEEICKQSAMPETRRLKQVEMMKDHAR